MLLHRLFALTSCLGLLASVPPALAQELTLAPRSDFGKVVLSTPQSAGGFRLEQQIGGDFDSEPAYLYPATSGYRKLGRAVGRLDVVFEIGTGYCTAFLISDTHLMTNHHCIENKGKRPQAINFVAGYIETGIKEDTMTFSVNPVPLESDKTLDYAILEVFDDAVTELGTLGLSAFEFDNASHGGMPLVVIGHPERMAQHISRKECRAAVRKPFADNKLRHTCDTLVGNSGSPVLSEDSRKVVALHHAGDSREGVNFAIPMTRIARKSDLVAKLIKASAQPAPAQTPAVSTVTACDLVLKQAQATDACGDWSVFVAQCDKHAMHAFFERYSRNLCEVAQAPEETPKPTPRLVVPKPSATAKVAPELTLEQRMAADPKVQECDRFAGSPLHPDRKSGKMLEKGTPYSEVNSVRAISVCLSALVRFPDHPRLLGHLGRAYDSSGDHKRAFGIYMTAADLGDVIAQNNVAVIYEDGLGIPKSLPDAAKWYRKAADQGFAISQFSMGWLHETGGGVTKSDVEASKWYRMAADQGHPQAQFYLSLNYERGLGVDENPALAVQWLTKAALQGLADAQYNLAWKYEDGEDVRLDYRQASNWYAKAAEQGHFDAQTNLGRLYELGLGVQKDFVIAIDWYRKAADAGDARGQYMLGRMYENGTGVLQSTAEATRLYQLAADQDHESATERLKILEDSQ